MLHPLQLLDAVGIFKTCQNDVTVCIYQDIFSAQISVDDACGM
jgi:hypothetical protein